MRISDWSSDVCSSDLVGEFNFESDGAAVFANSFAVLPELIGNCSDLVEEDRSVGGISLERVLAAIGLPFSVGPDRSIIFTPRDRVIIGAGFQIGRASCRERVCPYVENSGVGVSLTKKNN